MNLFSSNSFAKFDTIKKEFLDCLVFFFLQSFWLIPLFIWTICDLCFHTDLQLYVIYSFECFFLFFFGWGGMWRNEKSSKTNGRLYFNGNFLELLDFFLLSVLMFVYIRAWNFLCNIKGGNVTPGKNVISVFYSLFYDKNM